MKIILTFTMVFLLASCSITSKNREVNEEREEVKATSPVPFENFDDSLIINNLVYALSQLRELRPSITRVQLRASNTSISHEVETSLAKAGYVIEFVNNSYGSNFVHHTVLSSMSEKGRTTTYKVSIGQITAERDYKLLDGATIPESPLRVYGAAQSIVVLNDNIFDAPSDLDIYTGVVFASGSEQAIIPASTLGEYLPIRDSNDIKNLSTAAPTLAPLEFKQDVLKAPLVSGNVRDLMSSNFVSLFDEYQDIDQITLVFADDSMRIGATNKVAVQRYIEEFDPSTDIISVVGCSNGVTKIDKGNQLLAVGRANRVKEALIYGGIDQSRIFEEGCWGNDHFDLLPARGVVMTHKRKI